MTRRSLYFKALLPKTPEIPPRTREGEIPRGMAQAPEAFREPRKPVTPSGKPIPAPILRESADNPAEQTGTVAGAASSAKLGYSRSRTQAKVSRQSMMKIPKTSPSTLESPGKSEIKGSKMNMRTARSSPLAAKPSRIELTSPR